MKNSKDLDFLLSLKLLLSISLLTVFVFSFLDIYLFELSRSFPGLLFKFFNNVIDPISDILDPLNLIILFSIVLLFNLNIQKVISHEVKIKTLKFKTG